MKKMEELLLVCEQLLSQNAVLLMGHTCVRSSRCVSQDS